MKHPTFLYYRFIILFSVFLSPATTHAQFEDSLFIRYTVKDGLSSNIITAISQDDYGYIWVGTETGLNRFDGYAFKKFIADERFQIPSSNIKRIKRFGAAELGVVARRGFYTLNTRDLSTRRYRIPDSTAFSTYLNFTWDAIQLANRSISVSTATGFYIFDPNGTVSFRHDAYTAKDLGKRLLYGRDILAVSPNELLIYTYTQNFKLAKYDIQKREYKDAGPEWDVFSQGTAFQEDAHTIPVPISAHEFLYFYFHKDSIAYYDTRTRKQTCTLLPFDTQLEVSWESRFVQLNDTLFAVSGGSSGLYIFSLDRSNGRIQFRNRKFLTNYKILDLYLDKEKRLWVGTTIGLLRQRLHENFLDATYYPPLPDDLSELGFQAALRYKGKYYLTRFSKVNGVVIVDSVTNRIVKRLQFYGNNTGWNEITSIIMYHPDTAWLGTSQGAIWLDMKTYQYGKLFEPERYPFIPKATPLFSPVNRDGYAWFCYGLGGCVVRYDVAKRSFTFFTNTSQPKIPFTRVKSITYDSYGDVWIGGHSLARWNSREQVFDTLISIYGGVNKFDDDILALTADNRGSLWFHNAENGLLEYRIKEKKFVPYTMNDGLPSMVFQCLSPVVNDILWIGCATNLTSFNTVTKKSFVYDHTDGFPDEAPVGRRMYYDSAARRIYFFFNNIIANFPSVAVNTPERPGELLVQEVRVNNTKTLYHPADTIRLRSFENTLKIQFNIIEFETPTSYQLSYRLDNNSWTSAGAERAVTLNSLPAGKHSLLIKASGKNGEERLKLFTIIIKKSFWKTNGFLIGCALILVSLGYYLYKRRLNAVRQKADIDKQIAQTQMKALHAQMNPHFVFNSLNSIREMILHNESKEASHFLGKFAQLMRLTLDHSSRTFINLRATMDYLRRYMEMEQTRNELFTCRILADEELDPDETLLPPMLIQPFIENAIWHGVTDGKNDININIDFKKDGDQLVCIIDDTGIGILKSREIKKERGDSHNSVGITNIQNRIQLLNEKYGLASSVVIEDKSTLPDAGTGTRVTIRLPLHIIE